MVNAHDTFCPSFLLSSLSLPFLTYSSTPTSTPSRPLANLAAALLVSLTVRAQTYGLSLSQPGRVRGLLRCHIPSAHQPVNLGQNPLKGGINTTGIESTSLNECQIMLLTEGHGLIRLDSSKMSQVRLISNQHDHNVRLGVISQFLQPTLNILKSGMFANIINEEGSNGSTVVSGGDGAVALLAGRIPDLGLDGFALGLDGFGGEFYADCGFGVLVELIAGEAKYEV
mmetsp:Transcript_717/g.991  ORF Transcript_717/g.991 Transcript_717/m.991 type:complete len:227 (-) Transcript_717:135-815(-)